MPIDIRRGLTRALPFDFEFEIKISTVVATLCFGAALLSATGAAAQPAGEGFDKGNDDVIAADKQANDEKGDKMPGEKSKAKPPSRSGPDPEFDPKELPGKSYNFIGARGRIAVLPKFMLNLFASGGTTVTVPMIGAEFTTRKDRMEIDLGLSYSAWTMDPTLFKGNNEPDTAYEVVESHLKMVMFDVTILYDFPIDDAGKFSFLLGGGVGIGGVIGDLYRAQVMPAPGVTNPDPSRITDWAKCPAGSAGTNAYCDAGNNHYGNYTENSWANGGSKPFIFPWLALPQISLRYKPIKQLQTRLDFGFSTAGFFFGLGGSYGL